MQRTAPPIDLNRLRDRLSERLVVLALVLAAHAALLGGRVDVARFGDFDPAVMPSSAPVLTVRQILRPAAAPAAAVIRAGPSAGVAVAGTSAGRRRPVPALDPARPGPLLAASAVVQEPATGAAPQPTAPEPASPIEVALTPPPAPAADAPAAAPVTAQPATPSAPDGADSPIHPTRIAASFRLAYSLQRGSISGSAELDFRRAAESYELELKGSVFGVDAMWLVSRGAFDAAGLAPERFVDRRRGRDRHAANFDRAAGRITYSGPQITHPLPPGAQDRLSWMVQLPAIIDADPARFAAAGTRVPIFISGARGDAGVWIFVVEGLQTQGLRLTREPRRPYDTQVEVWLDPVRHHLPVRARLSTPPAGETLELLLTAP